MKSITIYYLGNVYVQFSLFDHSLKINVDDIEFGISISMAGGKTKLNIDKYSIDSTPNIHMYRNFRSAVPTEITHTLTCDTYIYFVFILYKTHQCCS